MSFQSNAFQNDAFQVDGVQPQPAVTTQAATGGFIHRPRRVAPREDKRLSDLRRAYVVIRKGWKKLSADLRLEVLGSVVQDGPSLAPVETVNFEALTFRPEYIAQIEGVFARAIVEAELPEPELEPISEYAPLVDLDETNEIRVQPLAAPDMSWAIGLQAAIIAAKQRQARELLLQDEEEVLLLLN